MPPDAARLRVCFFFNAQRHQLLHGISTAVELARRPGFEVHVVSPSRDHLAYARAAAARLGGAPIVFGQASSALLTAIGDLAGGAVPPKVLTLGLLARRLDRFDAIAVPERTSILLRRLGAPSPRYIHLDHGAGDRAAGFDPRIRQFDMVLMAGEKHRDRMAREGLIAPGRHAVVGYPKFDAADAMRDPDWRPFADDRPIVLYNPHFARLGSWERFGEAMLRAFAGQDRYNLIVAPHVRMADGRAARARWRALQEAYAGCPRIHIDPGSERSVDMTYTALADLYVGDVSSQVYEFLRTPKPCLFFDAHDTAWEGDENYAHWRFGPVERDPGRVIEAVDAAFATHGRYRQVQAEDFARTFAVGEATASARAADAIAAYLASQVSPERSRRPALGRLAAGLALTLAAGAAGADLAGDWRLDGDDDPVFVEQAVTSYRAAPAAFPSSAPVPDRAGIRQATGVAAPPLPAGATVTDVRVRASKGGPVVQVAALTDRREPVSLVAMRIDTPAGRRPVLEGRRGARVAYWEDGDQAYGVVGELPAGRLLEIATELAD